MVGETKKVRDMRDDWDEEGEESGMHAAGYYIYDLIMETMEAQFGDQLQPSRTPPDIRDYKNEDGSVKGELPMRAGNGQDSWFLIQSKLGVERPGMPGQPTNKMSLWSVMMWLGPATDAPHLTFEISVSPKTIFLVADMVPRRDLVAEPDYLDECYEHSGAKELNAKMKKDARFVYYNSPDLYTHVALSPARICHTHMIGQGGGDSDGAEKGAGVAGERPVVVAMKEVVEPYVRATLDNWIKVVKARARNVPPEDQEALSRRDKILKKEAVERDPGTAMLPMTLGPDLGNRIARALVEGEPRKLPVDEHFLYQRPHWRHWYGQHTQWDARKGNVVESHDLEEELKEVEAGGKKIRQTCTHHKADGDHTDEPYEFGVDDTSSDEEKWRTRQMPDGDMLTASRAVPESTSEAFLTQFLFLAPDQQSRVGLYPSYDNEGNVTKVVTNREVAWNPKEKLSVWSPSNDIIESREPPTAKLTGVEKCLSPDLLLGETIGMWRGYEAPVGKPLTGEQLPGSEYSVLHLPDGLSLCFPKYFKPGMGAFHVTAHWAIDRKRIHVASALYGQSGDFESFRTAHYTR